METPTVFESLEACADAVRDGGVIVHAAEGVMGLGCDPRQADAVHRLLAIKNRPVEMGLIVLCADVAHARALVDLDQCDFDAAAEKHWPGPVTLILPAQGVPKWVTGGRDSVALRVPDFPALTALVKACGGYLVSTSANPSGKEAPNSAHGLDPQLLCDVDGIVPGATQGRAGASQIIDARSGSVIR